MKAVPQGRAEGNYIMVLVKKRVLRSKKVGDTASGTVLPSSSTTSEPPTTPQPRKWNIIPSLPDVVLLQIFSELSYPDLCQAELICKRWQRLIHGKFRREIHELVVEQMGCRNIQARQNVGARRLTILCPFEAADFLSGVMRRHHAWLTRLTCDVSFLANVGKLRLNKDSRKKYFTSVENIWIVMLACSDELLTEFAAIEEMLFLKLHHVTFQIHLLGDGIRNAASILRLLQDRNPGLTISLEIHAEKAKQIISQLDCLDEIHLKSLKIICTDLDAAKLHLNEISDACSSRKISFDWLGFRDWYIFTDPCTPLAPHHVDTFRLSSCTIANVDSLITMLATTQAQKELRKVGQDVVAASQQKENQEPKKPPPPDFHSIFGFSVKKARRVELDAKADMEAEERALAAIEKVEVNAIDHLELAGHCVFTNISFLDKKARDEFEYRAKTRVERLQVDVSQCYFC
uniref:F-box domain-containing protein n=1 Tax=Panagrellus redivivus TaxID=6233 RepID=A0A7E4V0W9_PANRE